MKIAVRRVLPALLVVTTVALFAWVQGSGKKGQKNDAPRQTQAHQHAEPPGPLIGDTAEDFTTKTMSGKKVQLHKSFAGKLVLLDFWATWCPPCRGEIPHLKAAHEKYADKGLVILGVTLDGSHHISAQSVSKFTEKELMPWEQVYDDANDIATTYQISSIPTPILVDGDTGRIIAMRAQLRGASLDKSLSKHLAAKMKEVKKAGGSATP